HPTSWDVLDRFNKVLEITSKGSENALKTLLGAGSAMGIFNPMNHARTAPFMAKLPEGTMLAGAACQSDADGNVLCRLEMPAFSTAGIDLIRKVPPAPRPITLSDSIETSYYTAKIDPRSGALTS